MSPLSVLYVVFPFLILFFLHEIEEIITQQRWMAKNIEKPYPRFSLLLQATEHRPRLSTAVLAFTAIEESLIILTITALILSGLASPIFMQIWSALFIAFSLHLILHIVHAVILRSYVPGLITALIALPFSITVLGPFFSIYTPLHLFALTIAGICFATVNRYFILHVARFLTGMLHKP